jgi:hypothetical protein
MRFSSFLYMLNNLYFEEFRKLWFKFSTEGTFCEHGLCVVKFYSGHIQKTSDTTIILFQKVPTTKSLSSLLLCFLYDSAAVIFKLVVLHLFLSITFLKMAAVYGWMCVSVRVCARSPYSVRSSALKPLIIQPFIHIPCQWSYQLPDACAEVL